MRFADHPVPVTGGTAGSGLACGVAPRTIVARRSHDRGGMTTA